MTSREWNGRRSSSEKGAELVEFALVLPMLMLILLGMVDFGFLFQAQEVLVNASREGARLAILEDTEGFTDSDVQNRVAAYVAAGIPYATITPTTTVVSGSLTTPGGHVVSTKAVTVVYPYVFQYLGPIAALLGSSFTTISLTAATTMRTVSAAGG